MNVVVPVEWTYKVHQYIFRGKKREKDYDNNCTKSRVGTKEEVLRKA